MGTEGNAGPGRGTEGNADPGKETEDIANRRVNSDLDNINGLKN